MCLSVATGCNATSDKEYTSSPEFFVWQMPTIFLRMSVPFTAQPPVTVAMLAILSAPSSPLSPVWLDVNMKVAHCNTDFHVNSIYCV